MTKLFLIEKCAASSSRRYTALSSFIVEVFISLSLISDTGQQSVQGVVLHAAPDLHHHGAVEETSSVEGPVSHTLTYGLFYTRNTTRILLEIYNLQRTAMERRSTDLRCSSRYVLFWPGLKARLVFLQTLSRSFYMFIQKTSRSSR